MEKSEKNSNYLKNGRLRAVRLFSEDPSSSQTWCVPSDFEENKRLLAVQKNGNSNILLKRDADITS